MQIVCPNCSTSYGLKPNALGDSGRSVRCARCRTVWFAAPADEPAIAEGEPASAEIAPAGEVDPSGSPDDLEAGGEALPLLKKPAGPEGAGGEGAAQDAVDALWSAAMSEPVDSPSLVPAAAADAEPEAEPRAATQLENIETVAARRAPRQKGRRYRLKWPKLRWPRHGMAAVAVVLAAGLTGLIIGRQQVVQLAPQTASLFATIGLPVNLRGLVFENVRTTGEVHEGVPVLIVEGTIANASGRTVEVPRLRFAMRNRAQQEIYAWTSVTGRSILAPGEAAEFRTRLASPPAEGRDVVVRFFSRRDFLAGMR